MAMIIDDKKIQQLVNGCISEMYVDAYDHRKDMFIDMCNSIDRAITKFVGRNANNITADALETLRSLDEAIQKAKTLAAWSTT